MRKRLENGVIDAKTTRGNAEREYLRGNDQNVGRLRTPIEPGTTEPTRREL